MFKKIIIAAILTARNLTYAQDVKPIKSIGEASALIEQLKNNTIPQLREIHQCYVDAKAIVDDYRDMKHLWVGKNPTQIKPLIIEASSDSISIDFDLNVYRNFDGLGIYQKVFFEELRTFIRTYKIESSNSIESLQSHILKIDKGQIALSEKLYQIAKKDSLYLSLLAHMEVEADKEYSKISLHIRDMISTRCKNAGIEPVGYFIESDVHTVTANIEQLRGFTLDSIDKRNLIVKRIYQEIRQKYVDQYQLLAGQQLGQIGADAIDVLTMAKVGEEMLNWWTTANQNGLAKSLHLKYLQFETPRDLLLVEKQRGSQFEASLRSIKNAPTEMSSYYFSRLATFQKTITDNLKTLTDRGWKGQLERQILLNTKRKAAGDRLSSVCMEQIQSHLDAGTLVKTLDQFRSVENLYARSLHACQI